jgi:hypothetical protein
MKVITRSQLRRLIETTVFPKNPVDYVSDPEQKEKINTLIDSDEVMNQNMGYDLASMLQDEGGYEGDDYMGDLVNTQKKAIIDTLLAFIPEIGLLYSSNDPNDLEMWNVLTETLSDPAGINLLVYVHDYITDEVEDSIYSDGRLPDSIVNDPEWIGGLILHTISGKSADLMSQSDLKQIIKRISRLSREQDFVLEEKLIYFIHSHLNYTADVGV